MHNKGNYKQSEKAAFKMWENNSKWNNWQRTNLQNIQAAHATQYQENKQSSQKVDERTKQTFLQRRHADGQQWNHAQHHSLLEKCKLKWQWESTSYRSEWPSSKCLQTISAAEGVEKRGHSCTVGGNVNWYSHYGRWYGDSFKT